MRGVALLVPLALLGLIPLVDAQGHEHGNSGPILLAHDGPADGRQFVGNLAHFAAISHGDDAIPDFHQDVPVRVTLNGRVLFESTASSGHDYDGINAFDIVFPEAGPYTVEALDADGKAVATFGGEVLPAPTAQVGLGFSAPETVAVGTRATFTTWVSPDATAPEAGIIAHTDCWFEVLRGGRTEFRTKTHTHEDKQVLDYTFQQTGTHVVRSTCFQAFPSAKATLFAPVVQELSLEVAAGLPMPVPAGTAPTAPPAGQNAVVQGTPGGELLLVGTFDPYTTVGPDTLQHLVVAVVDPTTGAPRQHVDFTATLSGPSGVLFASDTLHEYDGLFELSTRQATPGLYRLDVSADAGDWTDSIAMAYVVAPPVAPTSAGNVDYTLAGTPGPAGTAAEFTLSAQATSGPFAHSEVDIRVLGAGPVPLLWTKLHSHAEGTFPFTLSLPAGAHRIEVDGYPLMPEAVLLGDPTVFPLDVAAAPSTATLDDADPKAAPGVPVLALFAALAALAVLRRRQSALLGATWPSGGEGQMPAIRQ